MVSYTRRIGGLCLCACTVSRSMLLQLMWSEQHKIFNTTSSFITYSFQRTVISYIVRYVLVKNIYTREGEREVYCSDALLSTSTEVTRTNIIM